MSENKFLRERLKEIRKNDKELDKLGDELQDKYKSNYTLKMEIIKEIIQREEILKQTEWKVSGNANYIYMCPKDRKSMSNFINLLYDVFRYEENIALTEKIQLKWHDGDLTIGMETEDLYFFINEYGLIVDYSEIEKQKDDLLKRLKVVDEFLIKITQPSWNYKETILIKE